MLHRVLIVQNHHLDGLRRVDALRFGHSHRRLDLALHRREPVPHTLVNQEPAEFGDSGPKRRPGRHLVSCHGHPVLDEGVWGDVDLRQWDGVRQRRRLAIL